MKIEAIRKVLRAQPFEPFHLHLADGGRLGPVEHIEFIALEPGGRELSVYLRDNTCHTVDVMLVTRVETKSLSGIADTPGALREDHSSKPVYDRIRELRNAQPFQPFAIRLSNGDRVLIEYADAVAVSPTGKHIVVIQHRDGHRIIEVALIGRLEIPSTRTDEQS
jgi:hypothetical protein